MTIVIEAHAEGAMLPIKALAGARRNGLAGQQQGRLKVAVTQVAEKGKANDAIVDVLCRELSLRKSQIALLSGATSTKKRFLIRGLSAAELTARIDRVSERGDEKP